MIFFYEKSGEIFRERKIVKSSLCVATIFRLVKRSRPGVHAISILNKCYHRFKNILLEHFLTDETTLSDIFKIVIYGEFNAHLSVCLALQLYFTLDILGI